MQWKQRLKTWVVPQPAQGLGFAGPKVTAGMYHYPRPRDGHFIRFHLRVEPSGESLLIAGASEALRLSRAGTSVTKQLLDGRSAAELVAEWSHPGADGLVRQVQEIIDELGSPSSRFPIFNLADPVDDPRDAELMAPFQADVEVNGSPSLRPILQKLWEAGIPHVRMLPDQNLADDQLLEAVEWAEDLGMIAGVRSLAGWLFEADRLERLAAVGTDYLVCPWSVDADLHARWYGADDLSRLKVVLQRTREFEMTPVVEIPLVAASVDALDDQLSELVAWDVPHAEVFALAQFESTPDNSVEESVDDPEALSEANSAAALPAKSLRQIAAGIEEMADEHAFHLTWLPPVAVQSNESVDAQARLGPRAGGDVTIRVLAGGDVLPPRGGLQAAGNLLVDSWSDIWGCAIFRRFRERVEANTRCQQCPGLAICAADCPADPGGWSHD